MLNPKLLTVAALVASLTFGAAASIGTAQEASKPDTGIGSGMVGMMGEMNRMMQNCNRMMQSMMQNMPASPGAAAPERKG